MNDLLCGDAARPSAVPHLIRPHGVGEEGSRRDASLCLYAITSQTDLACNRSCRRRLCSRGHWRTSPPFRTTNFTHFVLLPLSLCGSLLTSPLSALFYLPSSFANKFRSRSTPQRRTRQLPVVRHAPLSLSSCRTELMRGGAHTWTTSEV